LTIPSAIPAVLPFCLPFDHSVRHSCHSAILPFFKKIRPSIL
jgi:hypothetical protein